MRMYDTRSGTIQVQFRFEISKVVIVSCIPRFAFAIGDDQYRDQILLCFRSERARASSDIKLLVEIATRKLV